MAKFYSLFQSIYVSSDSSSTLVPNFIPGQGTARKDSGPRLVFPPVVPVRSASTKLAEETVFGLHYRI